MRKLAVVLFLAGLWAAGPSVRAQLFLGNQGAVRGVAYEGKLHYLSDYFDGSHQRMGHYVQDVSTDNWQGPWSLFASPDYDKDIPSGYNLQIASTGSNEYGQGVALYGSLLINASVVLNSKGDPWVMTTAYNIDTQEFVACKTECALGYTNSDGRGYGIAASVLNGEVYVFTRNFVLVSQDGVNYTQSTSPLADGLSDCEPLDAVTLYPASGPKVLVAFSKFSSKDYQAAYVVWDGVTLPMASSDVRLIGNEGTTYFCGATMLGTVKDTEYGMSCEFPSGSKNPCVQIFLWGDNVISSEIERYEYDTITDAATAKGYCDLSTGVASLRVYPWFQTTTDKDTGFWVQQQLLVLNLKDQAGLWSNFPLPSDFMVPLNEDSSTNGFGWQGTPTDTSCFSCNPSYPEQWRTYWSLVGVVLGSPPFAINGIDPSDQNHLMGLSNVQYGKDETDAISNNSSWSNSVMFSVGGSVLAGPAKDAGSLFDMDLSYKHGWFGKQSETTSYSASYYGTMGTTGELQGGLGTLGWAIFTAPVLITQEMELYAYDYEFEKPEKGTLLGQELTTVAQAVSTSSGTPPGLNIVVKNFQLRDPGGPNDEVPGLMTMQIDPDTGRPRTFPDCTDLNGWNAMVWEPGNSMWEVLYGTSTGGGQVVDPLSLATTTKVQFGDKDSTVTTQGQTNSTSVSIGLHFGDFLKLFGLDGSLTAGYSSECSNETSDASEVNQNLALMLGMTTHPPGCLSPDWYDEWQVQPYLLRALDTSAPWIPQNYGLNLPWCITWFATGTTCGGTVTGASPQPDAISGNISGGSGGSSYSIKSGKLVWLERSGNLKPIPLTADTFDPGLGAKLELNKHVLSATSSAGKWTRKGQVWTFKSKGSSGKNLVTLTLDFGSGTWGFEGKRLSLSSSFKPSDTHVMARLTVNGTYTFRFDAEQEVKTEWRLTLPRMDEGKLEVTSFEGHMGWEDRQDKAVLEGRLPSAPGDFGDVSFVLNGHERDIPLLALDGFRAARARGKEIVYKSAGTKVVVDFGKRKWSAEFEGEGFHRLMAPRWGGVRLGVKVGGKSLYSKVVAVTDFHTELKFKG